MRPVHPLIQTARGHLTDGDTAAAERVMAEALEVAKDLEAERDFFSARALYADHTWLGLSSTAMLERALTGEKWPTEYPRDRSDLGRCEETYRRAPEHLQRRMLSTLELFRRMLGDNDHIDELWCFECDHGGHSSTWRPGLCKEHAIAAGIDVRPIHERRPDLFDPSGRPRR